MVDKQFTAIFKKGSKTYFYSSLFFPKKLKENVFCLYSFVRVADDLVDAVPQKKKEFLLFKKKYLEALGGKKSHDRVIDSFVSLMKRKNLKKEWVKNFLWAMEQDLTKKKYRTLAELEKYMFGSAETIGLFMARLMDLPEKSFQSARLLGKSMQYINFIRDIKEDLTFQRTYLPKDFLDKYKLCSLEPSYIKNRQSDFDRFIRTEIKRYFFWQKEAEAGFKYIPKRYLIPIKTASMMYTWTAKQIYKRPMVVFEKKVKPSVGRILMTLVGNIFQSLFT